jgi:hypothetical protein
MRVTQYSRLLRMHAMEALLGYDYECPGASASIITALSPLTHCLAVSDSQDYVYALIPQLHSGEISRGVVRRSICVCSIALPFAQASVSPWDLYC